MNVTWRLSVLAIYFIITLPFFLLGVVANLVSTAYVNGWEKTEAFFEWL